MANVNSILGFMNVGTKTEFCIIFKLSLTKDLSYITIGNQNLQRIGLV